MSIHSLYKEILPPSVVEHVIESNFVDERERNLIVIRSSLLEIYRIIELDHDTTVRHRKKTTTKDGFMSLIVKMSMMKLELVDRFQLYGVIESVQTVRLLQRKQDSLALSFKEAKVGEQYRETMFHHI
jgi:cleavage and polyadenylation specificity factor subunit 1